MIRDAFQSFDSFLHHLQFAEQLFNQQRKDNISKTVCLVSYTTRLNSCRSLPFVIVIVGGGEFKNAITLSDLYLQFEILMRHVFCFVKCNRFLSTWLKC